jgi:hypothetical protein
LAWIAVAAFVGSLFGVAASRQVMTVDPILGSLVICTTYGAKVVPGDDSPDAPGPCNHCPACVPSAHLALAVGGGEPAAFAFPVPATARPLRSGANPLALHLIHGAIRSRGPPRHAA